MKELNEYTIQFVGLKDGKHHFDYQIKRKFFEYFEYEDFNDASIDVAIELVKKPTFLDFELSILGFVNVNCDLSNEPYNQKINDKMNLVVKFGHEYNNEIEDILVLPYGEHEINLAQYVYELIVLAVPRKLIHPGVTDGSLKSEILDKLEELSPESSDGKRNGKDVDPRLNELKKLLTDKK